MCLETRSLAGLRQRLEEILPVHVVQVDVLLAVSAAHDVVDGPRIFDSQLTRHSSASLAASPWVNRKM
jgi:hypothetical protein